MCLFLLCFFSRKKWSRMAKLRASPLARSWTACGSCVSWSPSTTRARTVWLSSSPRPAWPRRRRRPHRFSAHRTATHLPLQTTTMPQPLAAAAAQRRRPTSWRAGRQCEHSPNRRQRQQHLQRQEKRRSSTTTSSTSATCWTSTSASMSPQRSQHHRVTTSSASRSMVTT